MSRLGTFCERVIEAGWLAAIVAIPLYFDVYSSRVFEPDKITLLRSIVLVMLVAQTVVWADRPRAAAAALPWRARVARWQASNPLLLPAVILCAIELISTLTSIDVGTSFFGSYQRLQGWYTLVTYVALFFLLVAHLRRTAQLNRLLRVVVLTSVPISAYGLIQHLQLDPLPWGGDVIARVSSTMGNSIFLAAYLIMVIPITAAMLVNAVRRASAVPNGPAAGGPIATAPFLAYWATVLLAPNAFLAILLVEHAEVFGIWWIATGAIGFFFLLASHDPPFPSSRQLARIEVGGLAVALVLQVVCAFLTQSRGPWVGLLVGGELFVLLLVLRPPRRRTLLAAAIAAFVALDGLVVVFNIPGLPLGRFRSVPYIGRFGELTDLNSGTGRVRALIWQGAVDLFIHHQSPGLAADPLSGARPLIGYGPDTIQVAYNKVYPPALGDIESRNATPDRLHNDTLDHLLVTGVLGLIAFYAVVITGLVVAWRAYRRRGNERDAVLMVGVIGAIVAHVVEMQTGIAIVSTISYFWILLAITVAVALGRLEEDRPLPPVIAGGAPTAAKSARNRRERARTAAAAASVEAPARGLGFAWMVLGYLAVVLFGQVIAAALGPDNAAFLTIVAFVWLLLAIGAWAFVQPRDGARRMAAPTSRIGSIASGSIAAIVATVAILLNLDQIAADVYHKQGRLFDSQQQFPSSIYAYEQAIALAPAQDYYYLFLGRAYLEQAKVAATPSNGQPFNAELAPVLALTPTQVGRLGRLEDLEAAQTVLTRALALNPLDPDHYANLARLYRLWGEALDKSKLALSEQYYLEATTVSPNTAGLYDEWSAVLLADGKVDAAATEATKAEQLDPAYALTHVQMGDVLLDQKKLDQALAEDQQAVSIDPTALSDANFETRIGAFLQAGKGPQLVALYQGLAKEHPDSYPVRSADAFLLARTGNVAGARDEYQQLVQMRPGDWLSWKDLALTDQQLGNLPAALTAAQQALKLAPQDQQASLKDLIGALQKAAR